MSVDSREDPVLAYNFQVSLLKSGPPSNGVTSLAINSLSGNIEGGFNECTGLEVSLEIEDYKAGGVNDRVLKFPTRLSYGRITLKKGLIKDPKLWQWIAGFAEGKVVRRDGLITLLDGKREAHTVWQFRRGLPASYRAPSFHAEQNAVAIESVEIEHEGLELMGGGGLLAGAIRGAANAIGSLF